jgi:S-adenosylmethionine hydrolase
MGPTPPTLVTLTTDFGEGSAYVAAMKGVLLSINPAVRLIDLSHAIPPQDVRHAAHFLATCLPWFGPQTLHVVVVDPGVGTARDVIHAETDSTQILAPDNGCWTPAVERMGTAPRVRRVTEPRHWNHPVSATFHGRDIFAPVAARLSLGLSPHELGPGADTWVRLATQTYRSSQDRLTGEVVFADPFGNLQTNIPGVEFQRLASQAPTIRVGNHEVRRVVRTFGEAVRGSVVALVNSDGFLEIAEVGGSAARGLGVGVGTPVEVA